MAVEEAVFQLSCRVTQGLQVIRIYGLKVKGLDFNECFEIAKIFEVEGHTISTLHLNGLIKTKERKQAG